MNIPGSTLEAIYRCLSRQHYSCSSERANSPGDDASSAEWKFEIMKPGQRCQRVSVNNANLASVATVRPTRKSFKTAPITRSIIAFSRLIAEYYTAVAINIHLTFINMHVGSLWYLCYI